MYTKIITLTEHILKEERKVTQATGNFTLLMVHLQDAAKIIASHIRQSGLVDILGKTGDKNSYGEEVQKLDAFANSLLVDMLLGSGQVVAVASEELPDFAYSQDSSGEYVVFFDPLDGSSNIDTNNSIGTIFSIYHKSDKLLQPGSKQVAAGYIIYGPSVIFVYTAGNGVNGFTLDPAVGSFILSHKDITMPESQPIYSINEGNMHGHSDATKKYLDFVKQNGTYKLRYVGSMVADMHRTLVKGGIFLYPTDAQNPHGKERLMFEANPMAMLVEQAGGVAMTGSENILALMPESLEQKVPVVMGSKKEVEKYQSLL